MELGTSAGREPGQRDRLVESPELFDEFPYGLALVGPDRRVINLNRKARESLIPASRRTDTGVAPWVCCDLICSRLGPVVGDKCVGELVAEAKATLPEVRMDIEHGGRQSAIWVTGSPLSDERVLYLLRPGKPGDRRRRIPLDWAHHGPAGKHAQLRITTLGRFQLETPYGPIDGEWLGQRPGNLLKYLICERRRVVASDQIAEAMWPEAGPTEARSRLRYFVHTLRDKMEPGREKRSPSRFVLARRGGYVLDSSQVWIDADEFEREVRTGLATLEQGLREAAEAHLRNALDLYQSGFLVDDPYADWALDERERLHGLAGRALRARIQISVEQGRYDVATEDARRLSDMEPFDTDAQKTFIDICLRRGRRSEAHRRYSVLRKRMLDSFSREPDFDLAQMEAEVASLGSD